MRHYRDLAELERAGQRGLPGLIGMTVTGVDRDQVEAELPMRPDLNAPNGSLHAGALLTLADTAAGYGCLLSLPRGATGFTTIELKANFVRSAAGPWLKCRARRMHSGRSTQVWDATISDSQGRDVALFRCTQLILRGPGST